MIADVTEFRFVIVSHNDRAVLDTTLDAAFARLFPGFDGEIGERIPDPDDDDAVVDGEPTDPADEPSDEDTDTDTDADTGDQPPALDGDAAELAAEAERLYLEAQDLLRDGDLGGYQERIDQMGEVLIALSEELGN